MDYNTHFDSAAFLKTLTNKPGIYQMIGENGEVLYVGKARHLKKRVASYFQKTITHPKTYSLVKQIVDIQITITHTENEALLLENTLIKKYRPKYNVLFRDDKSYPYLYLSTTDHFPRLTIYRGAKKMPGHYFGPYPSAAAAYESLHLLQKLFQIRHCDDQFFKNRTRPCLQHQIKRCTAPCVKYIDQETYAQDVRHAKMFLEGKNTAIIDELISRMYLASDKQEYEKAVLLRDQISKLRRVQEQQYVTGEKGDVDVIAVLSEHSIVCVEVLYIRAGRLIGSKPFFPKALAGTALEQILEEFLSHYYLRSEQLQTFPDEIILNHAFEDLKWFSHVIHDLAKKKVKISLRFKGVKQKWIDMALTNAKQAILQESQSKANMHARFSALQEFLQLSELPQRLECFDVSHTQGEATVASCVVFDINGPLKTDYRRFNIENITQGDDYAAIRQAVLRRYTRLQKMEARLPDILIIDGGKGQFHQAESVLAELQLSEIKLLSIAKGTTRKAGLEVLHIAGEHSPKILNPDSLALHLIQHIRDEAHRFAIAGHRHARGKKRVTSTLEDIPGIGAKRRRDLLAYFGGWQQLKSASIEELMKVPGISLNLAQKIHAFVADEIA